ncbi:hypothetical protein Hanom_Chr02g00100521 [Helianthus anomalus]
MVLLLVFLNSCICLYSLKFYIRSKLQVLSFIFTSNFSRCHLSLKLMSFVLNVSKSYTLRPLTSTLLILTVK